MKIVIVKISEKLNKRNLLKLWLQATYPIFYYGTNENIWFLKKQWLE